MKRWLNEAARVYEREPCARTFAEDFAAHCYTGHVLETADFFCMGRAVMRNAPIEAILDPWVRFHEPSCDAWFVWLCAGDLRAGWAHWPSHKPWLGFERCNQVRWLPMRTGQDGTARAPIIGGRARPR